MTPSQRPILPAPAVSAAEASVAQPRQETDGSLVRKRTAINTACNACRSRRSKCDGGRPRCLPCRTKGLHCEYDLDVSLGQTRVAALKAKMEALARDNRSMLEALVYLKTQPAKEAIEFLEQIRSGAGLEPLKSLPQTQEDGAPVSTADLKGVLLGSPKTPDVESVSSTIHTPASYLENIRSAIETPKYLEFARVSTIKTAVHAFIHSSGLLFHIVSEDQVDIAINDCLGAEVDDETLVVDLLNEATSLQSKASICELFAIAAVGVLYMRNEELDGSVVPKLADSLYSISKNHLENAIEADPVHATKACAMLAMYNIVLQTTVALTYVELGLNLWQIHANQLPESSAGKREETRVFYRMTLRTLVLLQGWLSTSAGSVPGSSVSSWSSDNGEIEDTPPDKEVLFKMAMISIKKGIILRTIGPHASNTTIRMLRDDLSSFREEIPNGMTLNHLLLSTELPSDLRRNVFYMHLFYMSAYMLIYRLILRHGISHANSGDVGPPEAHKAAGDGLMAAKHSARILHLLRSRSAILRICWLSIFTAYISCLIILYGTAQKILYGYPESYWTSDLSSASKCIDVLEYCGGADTVASRLHHIVHMYKEALDARVPEHMRYTDGTTEEHNLDLELPASCLYIIPPGNSDVHMISRALLQLIRRPFQTAGLWRPGVSWPETELKIGEPLVAAEETLMGAHLEWSWETSHFLEGQKNS